MDAPAVISAIASANAATLLFRSAITATKSAAGGYACGMISGPLLDRIDIHIVRQRRICLWHESTVSKISGIDFPGRRGTIGGNSAFVVPIRDWDGVGLRSRVIAARATQRARFKCLRNVHCNATMRSKDMSKFCQLKEDAQSLLKMAISELNFCAPPSSRYLSERRDRDYGGLVFRSEAYFAE